jgi:hypothetical protein
VGQRSLGESATTVSMMACLRWVMSACAVGSSLLMRNGWWCQTRTQLVVSGPTPDPAHHQPGGDRVCGGSEGDERHLGVGDQLAGVRIDNGARVAHRRPGDLGGGADRPG